MWQDWQMRQPLLFQTAAVHAVLAVFCVFMIFLDNTAITGINRWIKPMKFCLSIAIYLGSMAWYWPVAIAAAGPKRLAAMVLTGTLVFEIIVIFVQSARGVRSHFNTDTPLDAAIFQAMGVVIVINIAAACVVCLWTFRAEPSAYVWGIRLGLISFAIFALEGLIMGARLAHSVGVPDGGPGLPIVNWSTTGGDLRIAHFLGMHALQILPFIGFVTSSVPAVAIAFTLWGGLSLAALLRALAGKPIGIG